QLSCLLNVYFLLITPTVHALLLSFFFLLLPPPPPSTLFPYTTLFRSLRRRRPRLRIRHPRNQSCFRSSAERMRSLRRCSISYVPDRKSTRLNSSHVSISYAVFCLKKKKKNINT